MYFHGTSSALRVRGRLLPPKESGALSEKGRKKNLHLVFFTEDEKYARIYAGRACQRFGGKPVVCRVVPVGEVKCLSSRKGATVFVAPSAIILEA